MCIYGREAERTHIEELSDQGDLDASLKVQLLNHIHGRRITPSLSLKIKTSISVQLLAVFSFPQT